MSRARDVVEVVARALVDYSEGVVVTETEQKDGTRVALRTEPDDLGKLIGRQGRTATAVRTLAMTAAELEGQRVSVDCVDAREER